MNRIKVVTLVAFGVFVALSAEAGQSRNPRRAVDANGNTGMVTVNTAYGFNITVHPAYASKFQKLFVLLKDRGYRVPPHITKC